MPIGPETPLTRIREIMMEGLSLYQLAGPPAKPVADLKSSKPLKMDSTALIIGSVLSSHFSPLSQEGPSQGSATQHAPFRPLEVQSRNGRSGRSPQHK